MKPALGLPLEDTDGAAERAALAALPRTLPLIRFISACLRAFVAAERQSSSVAGGVAAASVGSPLAPAPANACASGSVESGDQGSVAGSAAACAVAPDREVVDAMDTSGSSADGAASTASSPSSTQGGRPSSVHQ